ncbi:adenine deaminase [Zygosaccharomyces mellis]|uniref:Adenine deaminase n=1 Tax=Zygosaccharomyces mellis TaxID=42258 RepID=A0A4C2E7M4_9SACH|nr:adenine deaminase [Zygosaccharomyces mellis]
MVSQDFLKELPKCEHHLHLEGTLEPDLLFPLARRNGITLPTEFPQTVGELETRYGQFKDLQDFLDYYYVGTSVLIKEQDFHDLAWAYFQKVHAQGLVHAEVFYDPQSHTTRGIPIEVVTRGFETACQRAEQELGITSKLIMCLLRHMDPQEGLQTIEDASRLLSSGSVHGIGLDSAERPFPPELFVECYERARSINPELQFTAHAGEEGPAKYVSNSLDLLQVSRIDHGVNSVHDEELLQRLAQEKIMLTVCPLSNVKLQVVSRVSQIPLQKLLDANVPFSLNSDDPAYFGGYILDNYYKVAEEFPHWNHEVWSTICRNSIEGSWCDAKRKNELLDRLDQVVAKYYA